MKIINHDFENAIFLIAASVVMDGFDGTIARLTKTESNFGMHLDSLVDAVSFGLVPAVLIFMWGYGSFHTNLGKIIAFFFLSAGVIRLARFNVIKESHAFPENVFVGLPIPLGALSICSSILLIQKTASATVMIIFTAYCLLISFLMVSTIKYRTVKRIVLSKNSIITLFVLLILVAFMITYPHVTMPIVTAIYLISPLFFYFFKRKPKEGEGQPPDKVIEPPPLEAVPEINARP